MSLCLSLQLNTGKLQITLNKHSAKIGAKPKLVKKESVWLLGTQELNT